MSKTLRLFIMFLASASFAGAQVNLVPNSSFEVYDTCPYSVDQVYLAIPWFQPNGPNLQTWSSTDFHNQCDTGFVSVPDNFFGYQMPHSGLGYLGFAFFLSPSNEDAGREYAEVRLSDSLISNGRYCTSMYVCLAEFSTAGISNLQMYFSQDSLLYNSSSYAFIPVPFQASYSDLPILDTTNWVLVKDDFIAQGDECFLTLGNFQAGSQTNLICTGPGCGPAYYYIDDVSVVLLPELSAGNDDTICPGDSTQLTATISETWPGMQFEWLPHTGLADPYSLVTNAAPVSSITYTLNVTCATCSVPCLDEVKDSVCVFVVPQVSASPVDSICSGESATLYGTISENWTGVQYEWLPHEGLNDPYVLSPVATPSVTTTYTLTATCPTCTDTCFGVDTTLIVVNPNCSADGIVHIPSLMMQGEKWLVLNLPANTVAKIYDVRGRLIYQSADYRNEWYIFQAKGTYLYELIVPDTMTYKGKIVVQ